MRALRKHVRAEIAARRCGRSIRAGTPDRVVGTSKTFRSLARIAGAAPSARGPVRRAATLRARRPRRAGCRRLAGDDRGRARRAARASRPAGRAQLLAGALVADAAMDLLGVDELDICPWALREGVILRRLDQLG